MPAVREWVHSPDVQIPAALALAVALALGEWRYLRSLPVGSAEDDPADVVAGPATTAAPAPSPSPSAPFEERMVADLVRRLSEVPRGSPAWIAASAEDADALARARQIQSILERAGWDVRPLVRTPQRNRAGYFLFAADEAPPSYLSALAQAFEDVGIKTTFALGYRAYYEEAKRTRPDFVGFPFAPDQTFVLVVGRAS